MTEVKNGTALDFQVMKRVLAQATPYKFLFIATLTMAIIIAPIAVLRPYLINIMVDDYVYTGDLSGLQMMAIILIAVMILESVIRYAFIYSTNLLGQSVIKDLRIRVFNHITSLKLSFFDKVPVGRITTRTINDIEAVNQVFSQGVITIAADILSLFVVLGVMFYTSWQLTLIVLVTFPLLVIGSYIFKEKVKRSFQMVRNELSKMNTFLQERITGMFIVQIFNAEDQEREKFKKINYAYTGANLKSIKYYAIFFPFVEFISAAALGLMVWYGTRGVLNDDITIGTLVAFPIYISMLFRPVRIIADRFNTLQMGLVAAERVFSVLDDRRKIEDQGTIKPEKFKGQVEFKNVRFGYDPRKVILKDLSFKVEPGKTLAIVGSTGSGKSTIINLLTRFYELDQGSICVDDVDIKQFDLEAYRKRLALVLQDVFLFTGTVAENISLKNPHLSLDDVVEASEMIGAHEFFEKLPAGYDFQVTERGNNLSMGQRQLISFVRALVFNPDILILDEATSSIDSETESTIQYAIEKLLEKRTSLVIAHRLSTIRHADLIIVLENGEIIERGTHESLLNITDGHYANLYNYQLV